LASQVSIRPDAQKMRVSITPTTPANNPLTNLLLKPDRMDIGYIFPKAALNLFCLAWGDLTVEYLPMYCWMSARRLSGVG
jgi:hypothetical protein